MTDPLTPSPEPTTEPVYAPPPVLVTKPVKKQSRGGSMLLAAAGVVAVAGIAFAGGRFTAPAAAAAGNNDGTRNGFPGGSFAPGGFPGGFRGGANGAGGLAGGLAGGAIELRGQVTAVSATSITIKLDNGSDVTVPLDPSTTYHEATAGAASDVAVGSTVSVQPGTTNFAPGASPNPAASGAPGFGGVTFGPATDVTVVTSGAASATP